MDGLLTLSKGVFVASTGLEAPEWCDMLGKKIIDRVVVCWKTNRSTNVRSGDEIKSGRK